MEPPAGPFTVGANRGSRQPDGRYQVPTTEFGEHAGVDAVGLAGERSQSLDALSVGDLHVPPCQLELVVDEAGAVHGFDGRSDGFTVASQAEGQGAEPAGFRESTRDFHRLALVGENVYVHSLSAEIESNVQHCVWGLLVSWTR